MASENGTLMTNRYQSRAFLLLPMCANVGVIVGPLLGGITSDPATNYPDLFGGIRWLEKFPYSPPNLLSAIFLFSAAVTVFFVLEEVGASQTVLYIH
jgi:MFS family permease